MKYESIVDMISKVLCRFPRHILVREVGEPFSILVRILVDNLIDNLDLFPIEGAHIGFDEWYCLLLSISVIVSLKTLDFSLVLHLDEYLVHVFRYRSSSELHIVNSAYRLKSELVRIKIAEIEEFIQNYLPDVWFLTALPKDIEHEIF